MVVWCTQLSGRYFVILDFYLNQDYIARNLCENRDKPQMHCNGKCHLAKKLHEEDRKDQETPERKMENKSDFFNVPVFNDVDLSSNIVLGTDNGLQFPQSIGCPVDQPSAIFRPPIS
jgi:hypothetical protein